MDKSLTNNIDKSIYNEKSLYMMNIKELRGLANKLHIPAPTMMNKKDLVDYILKVIYGEVELPARSNMGRPKTNELDVDNFLNKLMKNSGGADDLLKITSETYDSLFGVGALTLASSKTMDIGENIETRTYFEDGEKCYLRVREFIASDKDIEVSKDIAKKFNLENLDVLDVIIEGDLFKIIAINGVNVKNKYENFNINSKDLVVGNKEVFSIRTEENREEIIKEIAEKCEANDLKLIIFGKKKYTEICSVFVSYDIGEGYSKTYKNFMKMFSLCENEMYKGEDIVVVFEDASDIDDLLQENSEDLNDRAKNNVSQIINKILKLGNIIVSFRFEKEIKF